MAKVYNGSDAHRRGEFKNELVNILLFTFDNILIYNPIY
jgi:hypothetical protein